MARETMEVRAMLAGLWPSLLKKEAVASLVRGTAVAAEEDDDERDEAPTPFETDDASTAFEAAPEEAGDAGSASDCDGGMAWSTDEAGSEAEEEAEERETARLVVADALGEPTIMDERLPEEEAVDESVGVLLQCGELVRKRREGKRLNIRCFRSTRGDNRSNRTTPFRVEDLVRRRR